MLMPLPDELEEALDEIGQCGSYVDFDQYTTEQTKVMEKLRVLGLVCKGWVLSPKGRQRLNVIADARRLGG